MRGKRTRSNMNTPIRFLIRVFNKLDDDWHIPSYYAWYTEITSNDAKYCLDVLVSFGLVEKRRAKVHEKSITTGRRIEGCWVYRGKQNGRVPSK